MENYFLVTGASSGIGRAIAVELSKSAPLILGGRNMQRLEETRQLCDNSERHIFWTYDLANVAGIVESLTALIKNRGLKIGGFVHSAGLKCEIPLHLSTLDEACNVMNVNFFSATQILKTLVTRKINGKNLQSVVLISSVLAIRGQRGNSLYSAAKGAVDSFARSMAAELAPNIRVNVINPGLIWTSMTQNYEQSQELFDKPLVDGYLTGRLGQPQDVAHMAAFLMSNKASWITGQNFVVDGGLTSHT
ncbi:MAG: SDR family oxidoreductase [Selenomonadaceae bacterium]|nr:SDR family oxidoreductase [Selenomonadaceae bacterium]